MNDFKNKILVIFAIIILGLSVVLFLLFKEVRRANEKAERWEQNYYKPDQQSMSSKEFKAWIKNNNNHVIDSLNKIMDLKLRPKNITNYQTIVNNYKDTNHITVKLDSMENDGLFQLSYLDPKECWGVEGFFHVPSRTFEIEERIANDSIYSLEYFTQKHILWVIPIARKQFFKQTWSSCKGKISETQIDIQKKPDN